MKTGAAMNSTNAAQKIMDDALAEAASRDSRNMIVVSPREGRAETILTMVIAGEAVGWIAFNADQLDVLISLLDVAQKKLRGGLMAP